MKIGDIVLEKDYTEAAIFCNENNMLLDEIEQDETGRRFIVSQNEKSKDEEKKDEIDTLKSYLRDTDWIISKISEKSLKKDEKGSDEDLKKYSDILAERARARERINELEGDVNDQKGS